MHSHTVLGWHLPASSSAFGCHEGRKLLSYCSSSVTALCSGADLPQTSFSRFWSPYIKKLWQPSLSCQQVPENHQHRGDLAGGCLSLLGLPEEGKVIVCPPAPHKHTALEMLTSQAPTEPLRALSPSPSPRSPPQTLFPPPSSSPTYLPQPGSDLCVRVCQCVFSVLVADKEPPRKQSMCVSSHRMRRLQEPAWPPSRVVLAC